VLAAIKGGDAFIAKRVRAWEPEELRAIVGLLMPKHGSLLLFGLGLFELRLRSCGCSTAGTAKRSEPTVPESIGARHPSQVIAIVVVYCISWRQY
jgi:hypothetical protein